MKKPTEKEYKYSTYNAIGDEVDTYTVFAFNVKEARKAAKITVANSRWSVMRHGRVTLK